jgi:glycosyltransferase involved in cell wall biosynthesis
MTLATPSRWLAELVRESFLGQYEVRVIHKGIDLTVFSPKAGDFRERHGLQGKKLVLGVAFAWENRKGLDVFQWLAGRLSDEYRIVLVGTNEETDRLLPENVLSIHRTHDTAELAEIYSAADVFVNPTREDNFPTTNLEALACGTPVVTFRTGGSPEMLSPLCGSVVEQDDLEGLEVLLRLAEPDRETLDALTAQARAANKLPFVSRLMDERMGMGGGADKEFEL